MLQLLKQLSRRDNRSAATVVERSFDKLRETVLGKLGVKRPLKGFFRVIKFQLNFKYLMCREGNPNYF
jgi:hypothetical protein